MSTNRVDDLMFIAQNRLELKQRREQSSMFCEFDKVRDEQLQALEADLKFQTDKALEKLFLCINTGENNN